MKLVPYLDPHDDRIHYFDAEQFDFTLAWAFRKPDDDGSIPPDAECRWSCKIALKTGGYMHCDEEPSVIAKRVEEALAK